MNEIFKIVLTLILLLSACGTSAVSTCPVNVGLQLNDYIKYKKLTEMSLIDVKEKYELNPFFIEGEKLLLPVNESIEFKLHSSLNNRSKIYNFEGSGSLWIVDFQKMFYFCEFDEFNWGAFLALIVTKSSDDAFLKQIASHIRLVLDEDYDVIIPMNSNFIIYDSGIKSVIVYITKNNKMFLYNNFQ